jgi:hypothetical protein
MHDLLLPLVASQLLFLVRISKCIKVLRQKQSQSVRFSSRQRLRHYALSRCWRPEMQAQALPIDLCFKAI